MVASAPGRHRGQRLQPHELVTIGIFGVLVTGLLIAEVVVDHEPKKLTGLFIIFAWMPLVVIHELAHAFCARLLGWRVCRVVVGFGPRIGSLRVLDVDVEVRLVPIEGFVLPAPRTLRGVRWKSSLIYLAGPGVELLLVLLCWLAIGEPLYRSTEKIPLLGLQAACLAALLGAGWNLVPRSIVTASGKMWSDGMGAIASFFEPASRFEQQIALPVIIEFERLARHGRWADAVDACRRALADGCKSELLERCLVQGLAQVGEYREALGHSRSLAGDVAADEPARDLEVAMLGLAAEVDEAENEAESRARRALDKSPRDAIALAAWGLVQVTRYGLPAGMDSIDRAAKVAVLPHERAFVHPAAAIANARLGRLDEAHRVLAAIESSSLREDCGWMLGWARREVDNAEAR